MSAQIKNAAGRAFPRWHHDSPERSARRTYSVMQRHQQLIKPNPNPFLRFPQRVWVLSTSVPKVTNEFNGEVLVKVIRRKFGNDCDCETFTSRQLAKHAETDEELWLALDGRLDIPRIGTLLREIKGKNLKIQNADGTIDNCCIEAVDYERHVASWKVSPSRG